MSKIKRVAQFDPSAIASRLAEAIRRDLSTVTHVTAVDPASVRFTEMVYEKSLLKKFSWDTDEEALRQDAFAAFRARMSHMRRTNDFLVRLRNQPSLDPRLHQALERAKLLAGFILGSLDTEEWFLRCRHSRGVTQGTTFRDTSLEAKLAFPVTTTRALIPLFAEYLEWDSHLASALFWANLNKKQVFEVKECSRATSVPKQQDKCRMIAIETTLGMFFQQGLMSLMYERLALNGLDVTSLPERHKEWAMRGSISGLVATIDFSSASDCVSTEIVKWILPQDWCSAVLQTRSPFISINNVEMESPIVSTMGNATTFPVETLVFYCLAIASVMETSGTYNGSWKTNPNRLLSSPEERASVSVFGDDCLLPTRSAACFIAWCNAVGFEVNKEKSYFDEKSKFRESCGGDYYCGRDVRGLYITSPSADRMSALAPWLNSLFNRIRTKYITYFGPLKWLYNRDALRLIFDLLREHKLLVRIVPCYMPEDSGIHAIDVDRLLRHYNPRIAMLKSNTTSGIARFTYHRFKYSINMETDDNIRYWDTLKAWPSVENATVDFVKWPSPDDPHLTRVDRQKGGYYVASGFTTVW